MPAPITEDDIEQAILAKLREEHGYATLNCFTANADDLNDRSGRTDKADVVFHQPLRKAALRINPHIPEASIDQALAHLTDKRAAMSLVVANREVYQLIRDGIPVVYQNADGRTEHERVRVVDFTPNSTKNQFLAVSQLWIRGKRWRRPDIVLYVNGLPLVFIELKNASAKLRNAYDDNLSDYKHDIPQLFLYNAVCILSNAKETKVGSITASWSHFFNWLRVDNETEQVNRQHIRDSGTSLERVVAGLCTPMRLLDYVENFILYFREDQKIIAQNHQFIGVNKAYKVFCERQQRQGKLGVFWHTQGAGKSFSMIFYTRKIRRKLSGNFTFVVVTDRKDLDDQIYNNFLDTETVSKGEAARPKNSEEMRKFLGQNKRLVFTLIHKFGYEKGKLYPLLSERDDIIVIVDEAHRSQYKGLAENMRAGLPNAQYLAFTGTPLLGKERKTNAWFGDYVSEYNFTQAIDDESTVPLFYQRRVPKVCIQNDDLSSEFYVILEDENLNETQQAKLEKQFAQELEVIKRDDRLDLIAQDIVYHFPRRGYLGKGMVIAVDKFTAVKLYDKVQHHWKAELKQLTGYISQTTEPVEKQRLQKIRTFMKSVDMAVVVSEDAKEVERFTAEGLNIKPHRDRINSVDDNGRSIEDCFKDPDDPLRLVFVCAMWLTGFDAPTVSTLYLDKPMQGHTLMQTIARANRVTDKLIDDIAKTNGEIVDYYNVFRNMQRALLDYAQGEQEARLPIQEKSELFRLLDEAIEQGVQFCADKDIDLKPLATSSDIFKNIAIFTDYEDILLSKDEWRKNFNVYETTITSLYEACKPEILSEQTRPFVPVFQYLRKMLDNHILQHDTDSASQRIGELLDESVVVDADENFTVKEPQTAYKVTAHPKQALVLHEIDYVKLREEFKQKKHKNIEIADLRAFIEHKLAQMLDTNQTRKDFAQRLQAIIERYNSGAASTENAYAELLAFTQALSEEDTRAKREGLSEDELELFDLLKKDKLTKQETQAVKNAARALLKRLRDDTPKVLVQNWYSSTQTKQQVKDTIENVLDKHLPDSYDKITFEQKCDTVFEVIEDYASHNCKWLGGTTARSIPTHW